MGYDSHQQDRRINLEPDHKRELINATERNGLLYCETRPWRTVEQFNENRAMFEEWRRSRVLKTLDDWREWESYLAGAEASRRGVRRGPDGVVGQARLLVLKAYTLRTWGFKDGRTYKAFADHLTEAGYPTSKTDLKNAKRAKFELIEHAIPTDAPGIPASRGRGWLPVFHQSLSCEGCRVPPDQILDHIRPDNTYFSQRCERRTHAKWHVTF